MQNFPVIALDTIPGLVILSDSSGAIKYANPQFLKTTGFESSDIAGALITSLWDPPHDTLVEILTSIEKSGSWQRGIQHHRKDGSVFQEVCAISKIPSGNGNGFYLLMVGHLVVLSDFNEDQKEAFRQLKESEESYHNVMRLSPIAIAINRSSDARYVEVNEAWTQRTGFKREEVLGRLSTELNAYRDLKVRDQLWEQFNKQGYVDDLELAFTNRHGERLYSLVSGRRIRFKGEDCLLYISTRIDALKSTQKALAEREDNYRTILELAPFSITISKRFDGTFLQVNKTFTERSGFSAEEVIGRTPLDIRLYANPFDRQRLIDILTKNGHVDRIEIPFRAKDGQIIENLVSMTNFRFHGEDCIISMSVDISALKEAQRALEESEARFRTIFETAADPIFLNDMTTGRFLDVNRAACLHLGYDRSEFETMVLNQITSPHTTDPFSRLAASSLKNDRLFIEALHIRKDGSQVEVEVSAQQMMQRDRQVLLSIVRDVTQRKQTERELANYQKNLEQMVSERTLALKQAQEELIKKEKLAVLGQLTATVSHELRNPLSVIQSSNFYLRRKVTERNEIIDKHFKRIDEQVFHCDTIVGELLEYTRGRMATLMTQNIEPWVIQVVEQIQEQEKVDIRLDMEQNLPPIAHDGDKMRLVLINLLNNAIQAANAMAEDAGPKRLAYHPQIDVLVARKGYDLSITVRDNGIGMDDITRQKAFEPLFTTKSRGTGIGLANVKRIVEEHGGTVQIQSRPGEGTSVEVVLHYRQ